MRTGRRTAGTAGGAAALALPQRVSRRRFVSILEGRVPGTEIRLGRVVDGEHQHRPGWDATLSAPKSVSLEALLYGNKAVLRAHDAAVRATLDWVEAGFLQTRGYDPATRKRPRVKADGLVAATFRHVASRNNDPQLHTHAVIANMTRNMAGEWRSVEPTALQRNRRLIGAWYRNDLARRLDGMGYVLTPTEAGGLPSFELAGYSPAMLAGFSTRRRDILSYMAEKGWAYGAKAAQAATLHTRKRKNEPGRIELAALWKARAEELGLSRDADAVRLDRTERSFTRAPPRFMPLEAVWRAVDHLEERHAVFRESDLLAAALGREPGRHGHDELETEIANLKRDGHLVDAGEGALTTRRTLAAEKEVVRRMKRGIGTARPLAEEETVDQHLAQTALTDGQKEAVRLVLLSEDPTVAVQGFAGTGKTRTLNELAALAGKPVFGLAPSAAAARVLAVEGGIGATTLQRLLTRHREIAEGTATGDEIAQAREAFRDSVVVVDESSMVGTVQMRDLQRILEPLGVARLVLVGDSLQLRSVEAGQPFRLLQKAGMATARMDYTIRQRSVDLKAAVAHMVAGDEKARAFVANELRLRERMSKEAEQLHDVVGRLRDCQARRETAEAGELPFPAQKGYGAWWADAWGAAGDAKPLLERKQDLAPHFAEDPGLGEDLETLTRAFDRVLPGEREEWRRALSQRVGEEQSHEQRQRMPGGSSSSSATPQASRKAEMLMPAVPARSATGAIREWRVMGQEARHAPPGNRLNQVTI